MTEYKKKHPARGAKLDLGRWPGPWSRCGAEESQYGFNNCNGCSAIWCTKCTQAAAITRLEETKKRYVYVHVRKAITDEPSPYCIWYPDRLK